MSRKFQATVDSIIRDGSVAKLRKLLHQRNVADKHLTKIIRGRVYAELLRRRCL